MWQRELIQSNSNSLYDTFLQCNYLIVDFTLPEAILSDNRVFSQFTKIDQHVHIGFDAKRLFHNFTGLGNYSRTLVANLKRFNPDTRITLFTPKGKKLPRTEPFFDAKKYQLCEGGGSAWRTWSVYKDVNKYGPDIFHGLSHQIPFSSDNLNCRTVVTMHDLIHRIRPKDFPSLDRMIYERKCKYACANADRIIAISENTKQDIIKYYKTPEDKIDVVYQSCDPQFSSPVSDEDIIEARGLFSLPETYILYVGSLIPRKNLYRIVEAMNTIPADDRVPLLIIGSGRRYMGKIVRYIQKHKLGPWVDFLGDVPFRLFPAIYHEALGLIYPSLYEGFGLPIIEALSVGIPVITANSSSLPEAGGDVSTYVDACSIDQIREAMLQLQGQGKGTAECVAARKAFAQKFAPDTTAAKLVEVYKSVL
jgi:glycosyltransferase involved in cell wall biosynthesis